MATRSPRTVSLHATANDHTIGTEKRRGSVEAAHVCSITFNLPDAEAAPCSRRKSVGQAQLSSRSCIAYTTSKSDPGHRQPHRNALHADDNVALQAKKESVACFQYNMIRRQAYATARNKLQHRSRNTVKGKDIIKAMVHGTQQAQAKAKVLGAFVKSSCEKQMRDMLAARTRDAYREKDWFLFEKDLEELEEDTLALELKYNGMMDLSCVRQDIQAVLHSVQRQRRFCEDAEVLLDRAEKVEAKNQPEADYVWQMLLDGEEKLEEARQSIQCIRKQTLEIVMESTGSSDQGGAKRKHAHRASVHSEDSAKRNHANRASLLGEDSVMAVRRRSHEGGGDSCPLRRDSQIVHPVVVAALIADIPEDSMTQLKDLLVSVSDTICESDIDDKCTHILKALGAESKSISQLLGELKSQAWAECADSAVRVLIQESDDTVATAAAIKKKLMDRFPHLLGETADMPQVQILGDDSQNGRSRSRSASRSECGRRSSSPPHLHSRSGSRQSSAPSEKSARKNFRLIEASTSKAAEEGCEASVSHDGSPEDLTESAKNLEDRGVEERPESTASQSEDTAKVGECSEHVEASTHETLINRSANPWDEEADGTEDPCSDPCSDASACSEILIRHSVTHHWKTEPSEDSVEANRDSDQAHLESNDEFPEDKVEAKRESDQPNMDPEFKDELSEDAVEAKRESDQPHMHPEFKDKLSEDAVEAKRESDQRHTDNESIQHDCKAEVSEDAIKGNLDSDQPHRNREFSAPVGWQKIRRALTQEKVTETHTRKASQPPTTPSTAPSTACLRSSISSKQKLSEKPHCTFEHFPLEDDDHGTRIEISGLQLDAPTTADSLVSRDISKESSTEMRPAHQFGNIRFAEVEQDLHLRLSANLSESLSALRQHICRNWGTIGEAARDNTLFVEFGQSSLISIPALVTALQNSGLSCNCGEVRALIQALDIDIEACVGGISTDDFMRIANFEAYCINDTSEVLQIHQTQRLIVDSLSSHEQLLFAVHVAKDRASKEAVHGTLQNWLYKPQESHTASLPSLAKLLGRCFEEFSTPGAAEFAEAVLSKRGLCILIDVMVAVEIPADLRALAVSVVSQAVEWSGGLDFKARVGATDSEAWASKIHVKSEAYDAMPDHIDEWIVFDSLPALSSAVRCRIPTPPPDLEDRNPSQFELSLARNLWRPLLENIDPNNGAPGPLNIQIFAQMLALLRQSHLPVVIGGPLATRVAQHVSLVLRRLQGSGRRRTDTSKVLLAIDALCECVDPTLVHRLAAALGGRRLLRDRLAVLTSAEPTLVEHGKRIFEEWCYERKRIGLRWPLTAAKLQDDAKLQAFFNIAELTGEEELALQDVVPEPAPVQVARPMLLTPPKAPKTAFMQPSALLHIQDWSGHEQSLITWLEKHSENVHVPHGYRACRKSPRKYRLAPVRR